MSTPRRHADRRLVALAVLGALVVLAGCGGGSKSGGKTSTSIGAPGKIQARRSLLGSAQSAGSAPSYVPTGRIVADSGFRPDVNGFGFENYGNDAGPQNMTPANVEDLFGRQVCATGTGASCTLIPPAKTWMAQVNAQMAGGHCMGFSVSALRFFAKDLNAGRYGANRAVDLPVQGNRSLQSLIAEDFAYQDLPAVTNSAIEGTPTRVLQGLIQALRAHKDGYTLAIIKADGTGGHAITPFAVEDRGNGQAAILVYDNNFPGIVRAVQVDTNADTWRYVGGINPSDTDEVYEGDARTKSMLLFPTAPGEKKQPCPFCPPPPRKGSTKTPHTALDKLHYIEVALAPTSTNHPHLVFADAHGRRTGYVGGRLLQEVPGIKVIQNYSVQNWTDGPEPRFHLPYNHPEYTVTVDGTSVTKAIKTKITVNGAGIVFYIQQIRMAPGQKDTLLLPNNNMSISYATRSKFPGSAVVGAQFGALERRTGTLKARLITLASGSIGFAPGSYVTLAVAPAIGTAYVSSLGDKPLVSSARFILSLDSSPLGPGGVPEHSYLTNQLPIGIGKAATASFPYVAPTTPTLPVKILDASKRQIGRVQVPSHR